MKLITAARTQKISDGEYTVQKLLLAVEKKGVLNQQKLKRAHNKSEKFLKFRSCWHSSSEPLPLWSMQHTIARTF